MSGLGVNGSLYLGANALSAHRLAIETAGRNLANVNTPNASRQRVNLRPDISVDISKGQQGLGVYADRIDSLRSELLDRQVVRQQALSGYYDTFANMAKLLEQGMGENLTTSQATAVDGVRSLTGLQHSLNAFFDSWQNLASKPNDKILRSDVVTRAENIISDLKNQYERLLDVKEGIFQQAGDTAGNTGTVGAVNSLAEQIALLNHEISRAEAGTGIAPTDERKANDLRDRRQEAIEQLAKLVNITTSLNSTNNRMIDVYLEDASVAAITASAGPPVIVAPVNATTVAAGTQIQLVNGAFGADRNYTGIAATATEPASYRLRVDQPTFSRTNNSSLVIQARREAAAATATVAPLEGELGGYLSISNTTMGTDISKGLLGQLNMLASNLVTAINTKQAAGFDLQGPPGIAGTAFFVAFTFGTNSVSSLSLSNSFNRNNAAFDLNLIAASDTAASNQLNGNNATAMANLRNDATITGYHRTIVSELGLKIEQAERDNAAQGLVAKQIFAERESVSGISMDEEMANLVSFQRAYEASARFMNIVNEMSQTLIRLGG